MQNDTQYREEDTIDLREVYSILKKRKNLIVTFTGLFTLLSIVYIFISKPIYEAKASIELAKIAKKPIHNIKDMQENVNTVFKVNLKGKKIVFPKVSDIALAHETSNILTIKTQGYDNNLAIKKLKEVITYITSKQNQKLDNFIKRQNKDLQLIKEHIDSNKQLIELIKININNYQDKLLDISKQDAALASIYTIEMGKNQIAFNDATKDIFDLERQLNTIEFSLSPKEIQKTALVGEIVILDKPIKPKKTLIVIIAFITGLMFSIFLAFFLQFLQGIRKQY